ncbi:O-antigen ligase family protein [Seonamhaeicola maritimus]|uniref:O-antigen ligase family protein n=2 Tax=Seonamhaeicola maritimus TaxID=2591822 RepID=A0A5C7GI14_9FLAO|nr:O-antigen ligase family protein [Seonamhaeicola maritimus]
MHRILRIKFDEFFLGIILLTVPFSNDFNSKIIIISVLFFLYKNVKNNSWQNLKFFWISFMLFGVQFLSFLNSSNFYEASKKMVLFIPFIAFPFLFSSLFEKKVNIYIIFSFLLYGSLLIILYAWAGVLYEVFVLNQKFDYGRGLALFLKYAPHHVYLSIFILITIYSNIKGVAKYNLREANLFVIPILYFMIFFLGSRLGVLIAILLLPYLLYRELKKRYSKNIIKRVFVLFLMITILGFFNKFTREKVLFTFYEIVDISTVDKFTNKKPFDGVGFRAAIWKSSVQAIKESPFFGYGIGDAQYVLNSKYSNNSTYDVIGMNSHNQYLQFMVYYGVILFLIIMASLFYIIKRIIKIKDLFLFYVWFVLLSFCFTESILNRQWGVVLFAFCLNISIYKLYENQIPN